MLIIDVNVDLFIGNSRQQSQGFEEQNDPVSGWLSNSDENACLYTPEIMAAVLQISQVTN